MKLLVVCTTDSMVWNFLIPHIRFWQERGNEVDIACSNTGFYFDELKEIYGFNVIEIPFQRSPFNFKNIPALIKLSKIVKFFKYDKIISQEPVGGVLGRIAGKLNRCENIYTAHGFHFYKSAPIKNWMLFYPIEWLMSFLTDSLVTINNEDYNAAQKLHAKRVFKINGIGVDIARFSSDIDEKSLYLEKLGLSSNAFIILTVAEMIPRKNYENALKTICMLKEKNLQYVICGSGPLMDKLKKLADELEITEKVKFMGFRKDVQKFYMCADMFFFPSYQEGLSIALIQAMAAGLPIVCSNIRGNIDVVCQGKGGLLYRPTDINGFAEGISNVMNGQCEKYREYNLKNVKKFSIDNVLNDYYNIISE